MKVVLDLFHTYSLLIELILVAYIYMRKMYCERRKRGFTIGMYALLILMEAFLLWLSLKIISENQVNNRLVITVAYCINCYLVTLLAVLSTWKIKGRDAVYLLNCSYLTQHMIHCIFLELVAIFHLDNNLWLEIVCFAVGYAVCFLWVAPSLIRKKQRQSIEELGTTLGVLLVAIILSAVVKDLSAQNQILYMSCTAYALLFCFYALWVEINRKKKAELENKILMEEQCFAKYKEQYELSQENITLINHKCHDLKHQIEALKHIEDGQARNKLINELESAVCIYDAMVHTGNEVLDTILTEKSLYCERKGITLACVADGNAVGILDPVDTYTIFGNALDNALECVANFKDKEMRTISVIVTERANMLLFQFENFYEELSCAKGGGYCTTKEDKRNHGFGLKSIQLTVEKYGGIMNICTENHIFLLQVMIPQK